jgi:hypothetical protein
MTIQVLYQGITRLVRCEATWTVIDLLVASVVAFSISCRGKHPWSTMVFFQEDGTRVNILHGREIQNWFAEGDVVQLIPGIMP